MPNHLINENSPYLLQHAQNPVEWYPWGDEAFKKAHQDDKPIFLSVGYAACHWCHVMAHESFEDEKIAAIMNKNFINIKVDREERPDIDQIYMQAVVALTRQGGWPMSVFLTPDGQPFYGGTYYPPQRRYQLPAFTEILTSVARIWREDRYSILQSASQITNHLQQASLSGDDANPFSLASLGQVVMRLRKDYDWQFGGWGKAPKFSQAMTIEFLLRQATRQDKTSLEIAEHALLAMAKGGVYDVVGGGFARYSVDDRWLVPHFEKMLYDNAQLALVYLHAYLITAKECYLRTCQETLDFVIREMTHPLGGFFSSLDADSEGVEGKYYTWTPEEIRIALSDRDSINLVISAYGITPEGNFEGSNILQRIMNDQEISDQFDIPLKSVPGRLAECHRQLHNYRQERVHPSTDDKVLLSWNALMSIAFAEAGRYLNRPDYTQHAALNLSFLLENLFQNGRLLRSWRENQANHNALLEDYAALILALLALYQSDLDSSWFNKAKSLAEDMVANFRHPTTGFYDTHHDHEDLILRPKNIQDNATPSGNSLAAMALLQISAYAGNLDWRQMANKMLKNIFNKALAYPTFYGQWLSAIDFSLGPVSEVAILGKLTSPELKALQSELWNAYRPRLVAAFSEFPPKSNVPLILVDRPLKNNHPTAYVCQHFTCKMPVNDVEGLKSQLTNY